MINQGNPGHEHANYVIEPVYCIWICTDEMSITISPYFYWE